MFGKKLYEIDGQVSIKDYKSVVDFCVLSPLYGEGDIERAANIAYKNRYNSICVLPFLVEHARNYIDEKLQGQIKVGTVVDFPLGASLLSTKVEQTKHAISCGADYIDVALNLANVKSKDWASVKKEIARMVHVARKIQINIIVELSALGRDEIEKVVKLCAKSKVDFVMTNTGFGSGGVSPESVEFLKNMADGRCGIKASGGVASREEAWNLIRSGANLIATSREI